MKILFSALLVVVLVGVGNAQSKLIADHVRSSERIVKGAPFSAEAITESVQLFPDGNSITRRTTSRMYRDGEGRLRREDMPKQIGLPGAVVEVPESILIIDPVAGMRYVLNSKKSTTRQFELKNSDDWKLNRKAQIELRKEEIAKRQEQTLRRGERPRRTASEDRKRSGRGSGQGSGQGSGDGSGQGSGQGSGEGSGQGSGKDIRVIEKKMAAEKEAISDAKTESLGVRDIDGIQAEGTRITTSIPAGTIGNEREINVVYEKWYSPALQLIIAAKHVDPAFGEQTYKLTNVVRSEPSRSLFSPPIDYKLIDGKGYRPDTKPAVKPRPPSGWKPTRPASMAKFAAPAKAKH